MTRRTISQCHGGGIGGTRGQWVRRRQAVYPTQQAEQAGCCNTFKCGAPSSLAAELWSTSHMKQAEQGSLAQVGYSKVEPHRHWLPSYLLPEPQQRQLLASAKSNPNTTQRTTTLVHSVPQPTRVSVPLHKTKQLSRAQETVIARQKCTADLTRPAQEEGREVHHQ